ncbi:AEC family transporter [Lutibaculum baratangense]|uniref:Transporter n=1 Tax=Lutibaculum baratangense AMV1 TaxID=631454 RepID=V4RDZ2_9HYPH|nr:AEC family transporter [Lutibaculum baratangense]ESR23604.1 hypothetical protein N177_3672 [Lutibaculum baratangense AMV1]
MMSTVQGLAPVLLVIATGWGLTRSGIIPPMQRGGIEKLAYFVLFPCLIVGTLAGAELGALPWRALGATLFLSVVVMAGVCLLLKKPLQRRLRLDGPGFTSIFQGSTRWNTFIALALAGSLYGGEGLALIAVAMVAMIPVLNVMAVAVLAQNTGSTTPSLASLGREIARNPLIAACVVGLAAAGLGLGLDNVIGATLDIFGRGALGVGLLAVGMGLDLSALRRPRLAHWAGCALRLVLMPAVGLAFAMTFGLSGTALGAALIALAVPTAPASYLLARQMGGDAELMAELITLQTICAMLTLPLWIALVGAV